MSTESGSEVRLALWEAICESADVLGDRCPVYRSPRQDPSQRLSFGMSVVDVPTWKLVEVLSMLSILRDSDRVISSSVCNVLGKTGPIRFEEEGNERYLWTQPRLSGQLSLLGGRPDLLVTTVADTPDSISTIRVVECKCRTALSTPDIRAEFGKAYDLRVASYVIWSFYTPPPRLVEGARRLGLNLESLAFDTQGARWISEPEKLGAYVGDTLEAARREQRFARALLESGQDISRKLER